MTYKEKLEVALEALDDMRRVTTRDLAGLRLYANETYKSLTTPMMETVEVKRWMISNPSGGVYSDTYMTKEAAECKASKMSYPSGPIVELTGTYSRPIKEREEAWEGRLVSIQGDAYARLETGFDMRLLGSQVEVRLKGE